MNEREIDSEGRRLLEDMDRSIYAEEVQPKPLTQASGAGTAHISGTFAITHGDGRIEHVPFSGEIPLTPDQVEQLKKEQA